MVQREIIRRVEAHTGRRTGNWEVTISSHSSPDKKRPTIQIITLSSQPKRIYILAGIILTDTEPAFVALMRKISAYAPKTSRSVRGVLYDFADFGVAVGMSFDKHGSPTGVIVEIEYRPCAATSECEQLIGDLMEKIAAPLVPPPQASQDPAVSVAATTAYNYGRVMLDGKKVAAKDLVPFSTRTTALLYAKLLRS